MWDIVSCEEVENNPLENELKESVRVYEVRVRDPYDEAGRVLSLDVTYFASELPQNATDGVQQQQNVQSNAHPKAIDIVWTRTIQNATAVALAKLSLTDKTDAEASALAFLATNDLIPSLDEVELL